MNDEEMTICFLCERHVHVENGKLVKHTVRTYYVDCPVSGYTVKYNKDTKEAWQEEIGGEQ